MGILTNVIISGILSMESKGDNINWNTKGLLHQMEYYGVYYQMEY